MTDPLEDRYLTVEEVAKLLHLSKMTVYRLISSRELGAVEIGRSFRIPESVLRAYLKKQRTR